MELFLAPERLQRSAIGVQTAGKAQRLGVLASPPARHLGEAAAPWATERCSGPSAASVGLSVVAGCVCWTSSSASKRSLARSRRQAARRVPLSMETAQEEILQADVQTCLDDAMAKGNAGDLLFGSIAGSEPVPGSDELSYVYFPDLDVGPFRAKVRMTCAVAEPKPSRAEVLIQEINPGVVDVATGQVEYQTDPTELLEATSKVVVRWRRVDAGLRVSQVVTQRLIFKIPDWFPVPDSLFAATLRPFVEQSIGESMKQLFLRIRQLSK
eukprot:TRINITY_DN47347_c0_g1_i1.p1 TRINITY_DN47347_c0_g1~~TRINITY_DN47347_c0_g1_i1.p1  ORF type:complete len:269 (-),score=36.80 TRINITY_DN47347_c0_g1_i1:157-963(-)